MPLITLLSDFDAQDTSVALVKAALLQHIPYNRLVDISHAVTKNDLKHSAYLTRSTYLYYPTGTVHLLLAGLLASPGQRLLLLQHEGHIFLAPDNGVLSLTFGSTQQNVFLCYDFNRLAIIEEWIMVITKVITQLNSDNAPEKIFTPYASQYIYTPSTPLLFNNRIDCNILYVNRYGNMILNMNREQFSVLTENLRFGIKILGVREEIETVCNNYSDVEEGKYLCRFNDSGYLEIAINRSPGMAFEPMELPPRQINYKTVSISLYPLLPEKTEVVN